MKEYSFYHAETGHLANYTLAIDHEDHASVLEANTPPGHRHIEGAFDHLCQRIDPVTLQVLDHQPIAPSNEHEWCKESKRWKLNQSAQKTADDHADAKMKLSALENKSLRALREYSLGYDGAQKRLQDIDDEIAELRKQLDAGEG